MSKVRFTWSVDEDLLYRVKVQAAKEKRAVNSILDEFAIAYLAGEALVEAVDKEAQRIESE